MTRWAALAFAVLCGLMFTGVLEPLTQGRDQTGLILVTPAAATVGLAFAVRGWRMLLGPVGLVVAAIVAMDDPLAAAVVGFAGLPVLLLVAATAVVWARRMGSGAERVAAAAFAVGSLPLLWGAAETARRATAPELPKAVQQRLPLDDSLGRICDDALSARELRPRAEALLHELRAHPRSVVVFTYHWAHEPDERERITVREVAEEQLRDLAGRGCDPALQRRLRDAL